MKERQREPRTDANLPLCVWGIDTKGERFLQEARARDISLGGALLSGLEAELNSGDVIGILYGGRKARYRVVWVLNCGADRKVQAAVQRIDPDVCPWKDLLSEPSISAPSQLPTPAP